MLRRLREVALALEDVKLALERVVEGGGDPDHEQGALERARVVLRDLEGS